jgi:hypothetical protein
MKFYPRQRAGVFHLKQRRVITNSGSEPLFLTLCRLAQGFSMNNRFAATKLSLSSANNHFLSPSAGIALKKIYMLLSLTLPISKNIIVCQKLVNNSSLKRIISHLMFGVFYVMFFGLFYGKYG